MTYSLPTTLPPLDCLVAAIAAARCGSFSAAALDLGVSHAAISRRIAGAESWAGIRLFERHGRGVTPTVDGQRLLVRVIQAFDIIDHAADRWRKPLKRRSVTIATTPSFARLWLLPRVAGIEEALPSVRLEIIGEQKYTDMQAEKVDIAIRYGRGGWKLGKEQRLFGQELHFAVASIGFQKRGQRFEPAEIADMPLIHNTDTTLWRAWLDAHGIAFRGKNDDRVFSGYGLTLAAAQAGLGVALINCRLTGMADLPPDLQMLHAQPVNMPLGYFLVLRAQEIGASQQKLVQHLLDLAAG